MGYGAQEIDTRWALQSRRLWSEFFESVGQPGLFTPTGVLWTPPPGDPAIAQTTSTLEKCGVPFEFLTTALLQSRFPQFTFSSERIGILEPHGRALVARRAARAVLEEAIRNRLGYFRRAAGAP